MPTNMWNCFFCKNVLASYRVKLRHETETSRIYDISCHMCGAMYTSQIVVTGRPTISEEQVKRIANIPNSERIAERKS